MYSEVELRAGLSQTYNQVANDRHLYSSRALGFSLLAIARSITGSKLGEIEPHVFAALTKSR
jgi:hypothetical protein